MSARPLVLLGGPVGRVPFYRKVAERHGYTLHYYERRAPVPCPPRALVVLVVSCSSHRQRHLAGEQAQRLLGTSPAALDQLLRRLVLKGNHPGIPDGCGNSSMISNGSGGGR